MLYVVNVLFRTKTLIFSLSTVVGEDPYHLSTIRDGPDTSQVERRRRREGSQTGPRSSKVSHPQTTSSYDGPGGAAARFRSQEGRRGPSPLPADSHGRCAEPLRAEDGRPSELDLDVTVPGTESNCDVFQGPDEGRPPFQ